MKNRIKLSFLIKNLFVLLTFLSIISCDKKSNLTNEELKFIKENPDLKVAVFPYYAPYQFINEQGEIDGIFIDFLKIIEQKNNIKFKKVYYNKWDDVLIDAKNNKIDLIIEIQQTKSRSEYLNFFEPLFESQLVIAQNKNITKIASLENFGENKLVLPNNYSIVETLKIKYPTLNISTEVDDSACLKKVNNGQYDAFVGPSAVVNYFIKKEKLSNIIISNKINETYTPSFAVNKNDVILTSIFRKNLDNISSQEKKKIIDNWLYNLVVPFYEKSIFWIYVSLVILGLLLVFSSISVYLKFKVKKRTLELNIAKEKAEESDRFKTNLIQNISHEIRTPMNGIIGFSELLKSNNLDKADQNKYLDVISKSTRELENSINNILDISQLETKQIAIDLEFINFSELLKDLHKQFLELASQKNLTFSILQNDNNPDLYIKTDGKKLKKILFYLIDNAIKFTETGFVNISYELNQNSLTISVQDSGICIEEKDKDLIFRSFSQSKKAKFHSYDGLGLGLYFAKRYAELLSGSINFSSVKNIGSQFNVVFEQIESNEKLPEKKIQKIKSANDKKFNVLIADDADVNYLLLQKLLSKNTNYQFNITRAENGQKAIDLFMKNNHYDLILMDIKMPIIDGYEATRTIKSINPELIIIAQTAFSRDEDVKNAFDAGCNDFIAKPIESARLNEVLEKYLEY